MILPGFSHDENILPRIPRIVKRCLPCYFTACDNQFWPGNQSISSLPFTSTEWPEFAEKEIISTAVADITKEARRARDKMSIYNAYRKHLDCSCAWRLRWNSPRQKCWWCMARNTQRNPKSNLLGSPSPIDTYLYARICAGEAAELFKNKGIMAQTPKFHKIGVWNRL